MKIVIDIPETIYEGIIDADKESDNWKNDLTGMLCKGVVDGTPLPKGQGRLIDYLEKDTD